MEAPRVSGSTITGKVSAHIKQVIPVTDLPIVRRVPKSSKSAEEKRPGAGRKKTTNNIVKVTSLPSDLIIVQIFQKNL